ncbi:MAG TPA: GDP-mannose 4,6-dehydratase [Solirubrobacteraceae bacterium]|nr:GDP-mannose 4,6-dehydratase [Solirubrobacteraceae bacterium]
MPRALITGMTGQDGSYLTELLLAEGYDVVGMVRAPVSIDGVSTIHGDLGDPASLRAAVLESEPDELYHLAAPTFVPASWKDPAGTLALVAGATATLLCAAREAPRPPRVLVASSGEVFGAASESPQNEQTPMRPRSPYGVAKVAAYGLVDTLRAKHGLHASSAIAYNHESPRRPERFLPRKVSRGAAAIKLGLQDELVLGDLSAVRDWCHARDVVRGYHLMLGRDEPGDYVLASGVGRTVRELVDAAFGCIGLDPGEHVVVDEKLVRPSERTPPVGDITKARERLGWEPETSFQAMIEEMVRADLEALSSP